MACNKKNPLIVSKVGIIGAGVSGIAAAKQLSHHKPIVFEASDSIGGVWKSCSYYSTKLQSYRSDYEFSDFSWQNRDDTTFPSYLEILDYLKCYAYYFDVFKYVKFNSKVVELRFIGDRDLVNTSGKYNSPLSGHPIWKVAVQTHNSDDIQVISLLIN